MGRQGEGAAGWGGGGGGGVGGGRLPYGAVARAVVVQRVGQAPQPGVGRVPGKETGLIQVKLSIN